MRMAMLCLVSLSLTMGTMTSGKEGEQQIPLIDAELSGEMAIEEAIRKRRSFRDYGRKDLTLDDVSQLLWAAQGVTGNRGVRSAPSAGALYPLELYVVAGDVDMISPGVYRYRPKKHDLVLVANGDRRKRLATAALNQSWVRRAPAVLVITGVYKRTMDKYGQRGRRYVHMEVGHAAQNIYLQATARDLGTVMVGAFKDDEVQDLLGLPPDHMPLALMPVGHRR